jgi:hypothetical protein
MSKKDIEKKERALAVAEKVKVLLMFVADFIPELDLLEEVATKSDDRVSIVMAAAPIIEAFGMSWSDKQFEVELQAKRAKALYNLVKVIKTTEDDRVAHKEKSIKEAAGREQLRRALGI